MNAVPFALTTDEQQVLLRLAREAIRAAACGGALPQLPAGGLPAGLTQAGACFVTIHKHGALRGCTGVLSPRTSLAQEVIDTAVRTALEDPRFEPVTLDEVPTLHIEISVLGPRHELKVEDRQELPRKLQRGIDGVLLTQGQYRATFLPQVWERVPDPVRFLEMLSNKMGLSHNAWRDPRTRVEVYQVFEFSEP
jgi:hypothetical protein